MLRDIYISVVSVTVLVLLSLYTFGMLGVSDSNIIGVDQINKRSNEYENRDVTIPATKITDLTEDSLTLHSWDGKSKVTILVSETTEIEGELGENKIITIEGISFLDSRGYLVAKKIHVHENYYLRVWTSLIAVIFVLYLIIKERVLKCQN